MTPILGESMPEEICDPVCAKCHKYHCVCNGIYGKDGNMKTFDSGAVRSTDADHARYDLIPRAAIEALGRTLKEGADKYGEQNWKKGIPTSDFLNHCLQHLYKYLDGDRSEDHIGHAMCNLAFLAHFESVDSQ